MAQLLMQPYYKIYNRFIKQLLNEKKNMKIYKYLKGKKKLYVIRSKKQNLMDCMLDFIIFFGFLMKIYKPDDY